MRSKKIFVGRIREQPVVGELFVHVQILHAGERAQEGEPSFRGIVNRTHSGHAAVRQSTRSCASAYGRRLLEPFQRFQRVMATSLHHRPAGQPRRRRNVIPEQPDMASVPIALPTLAAPCHNPVMSGERKKAGAGFWCTLVLLAMLIYVASIGPVLWSRDRHYDYWPDGSWFAVYVLS